MKTLKALSALLTYPSAEMVGAIPEIRSILAAERMVGAAQLAALDILLVRLASSDLYALQEGYVQLFDRTRFLSLHLFEHVHGESRDRGQAMVDLQSVYRAGGFEIDCGELPDFVPLFLEYCSMLEEEEARALLSEPAHVLATLGERLRKKESDYACIFEALVEISATKPAAAAFEALAPAEDVDPNDLNALDAVWEEEEIRFGLGSAAECGVDGLAAKLRQSRRPAPGVEVPSAGGRTVFTHIATRT